jgi:hypothetical protein
MTNTDWAIVVGVQIYPGLTSLGGPKNDAEAFCEWLVDPGGGGLKPNRAKLIVTPPDKAHMSEEDAEPTEVKVRKAAEAIQKQAIKNLLKKGTKTVGRRLYLYFAGHGFSPRIDQTVLLMADATRQHVGPPYHWLGITPPTGSGRQDISTRFCCSWTAAARRMTSRRSICPGRTSSPPISRSAPGGFTLSTG